MGTSRHERFENRGSTTAHCSLAPSSKWSCRRPGTPNAARAEAPLWPGRVNGGLSRFAHQGGGLDWSKPWERDAFVKRQFKPALAAVDLPSGVRLHDLRHSYVSILASAGVPSYRIAEYAGHASDSITRTTYMHLFQTDASADMDKLDRPAAIPGPGEKLVQLRTK